MTEIHIIIKTTMYLIFIITFLNPCPYLLGCELIRVFSLLVIIYNYINVKKKIINPLNNIFYRKYNYKF